MENFTYFSNLNLSNNNISDLSCLSNIVGISNLDLSNNPKLTDLEVSNNNLTSINLENNLELGYLDVTNNQLINLDISNNYKISNLYISNNLLTGIKTSHLENLSNHDLLNMANLNTEIVNFYPEIEKTIYNRENKIITTGKIGTGFTIETEYNIRCFREPRECLPIEKASNDC